MANEGFQTSGNTALKHYAASVQPKDEFDKVFEVEIECWCYGFAHFEGNLNPELIHRVIQEMAPVFKAAVEHNYIFDLLKTANRVQRATRCLVHEKELAISMLLNMPVPYELDEEAQFVLAQIVDQAEKVYGDVLRELEKHWVDSRVKTAQAA